MFNCFLGGRISDLHNVRDVELQIEVACGVDVGGSFSMDLQLMTQWVRDELLRLRNFSF